MLEVFKNDCRTLDHDVVVEKHLLDGSSFFFSQEEEDEFQFKKDIAESLAVHIRDVVIVGSGKLGFSIKPDNDHPGLFPFRKFDARHIEDSSNKKSDLDIAIVSNSLFDSQLVRLYNYTSQYVKQDIWIKRTDRNSLAKYILKGWLRPDYIPKEYSISDNISAVLEKYKREFNRDVNIGIYKSWFFFEQYHINNIRNIHVNIIANA